jgi:hypothetical protein
MVDLDRKITSNALEEIGIEIKPDKILDEFAKEKGLTKEEKAKLRKVFSRLLVKIARVGYKEKACHVCQTETLWEILELSRKNMGLGEDDLSKLAETYVAYKKLERDLIDKPYKTGVKMPFDMVPMRGDLLEAIFNHLGFCGWLLQKVDSLSDSLYALLVSGDKGKVNELISAIQREDRSEVEKIIGQA